MRLTQVWYAKVYVYQVNICGNLWLSEQEKERNEMEKEERKRPLVFLLGDFEECKDQDTKVKLACAVMTEFTSDPGYNLDYLWPEEKQSIMVARRIWLEHRVFG